MVATFRRLAAFAACAVLLAGGARAQDAPEAETPDTPEERAAAIEAAIRANTDEVVGIVRESAAFLAAQPKYSFKVHTGFDVLQPNGQKLEFGATREVTVRRPDRVRVDTTQRDGVKRSLFFDGENLSVDLPDDQAYVQVAKPGSADAAVDYLVDDLQTPAPLHDFLKSNYFADAEGNVRSGFVVGEETIGKRRCMHLALRGEELDLQLWVETGARPLPCSMIITYKLEEQSPQFWATFYDWNLAPKAPDGLFDYSPPAGAERLSIQTAIDTVRDEQEVQ